MYIHTLLWDTLNDKKKIQGVPYLYTQRLKYTLTPIIHTVRNCNRVAFKCGQFPSEKSVMQVEYFL